MCKKSKKIGCLFRQTPVCRSWPYFGFQSSCPQGSPSSHGPGAEARQGVGQPLCSAAAGGRRETGTPASAASPFLPPASLLSSATWGESVRYKNHSWGGTRLVISSFGNHLSPGGMRIQVNYKVYAPTFY